MFDRLTIVHERGLALHRALTRLQIERTGRRDSESLKSLNRNVIQAAFDLERAANPDRIVRDAYYDLAASLDPSHASKVEGVVRWYRNWITDWFPGRTPFGCEDPVPTEATGEGFGGLCLAQPHHLDEYRRSLDSVRVFIDENDGSRSLGESTQERFERRAYELRCDREITDKAALSMLLRESLTDATSVQAMRKAADKYAEKHRDLPRIPPRKRGRKA